MPYAESPLVDEPQHEQASPPDGNLQVEEQLPQEVAEELLDETPQLDAAPLDAYEPRRIEVTPYADSPLVDEPQHEQASPPDGNLQAEEQWPQEVAEELPDETPQLDAAPLDAYEPRRVEVMPYADSPLVDEPQHEQTPPRDEESAPIERADVSDAREFHEHHVSGQPEHWEAIFGSRPSIQDNRTTRRRLLIRSRRTRFPTTGRTFHLSRTHHRTIETIDPEPHCTDDLTFYSSRRTKRGHNHRHRLGDNQQRCLLDP
jgi:hypothetical protein